MAKMELLENLHGIGRIGQVVEVSKDTISQIGEKSFQKPSENALKKANLSSPQTSIEDGVKNRAIQLISIKGIGNATVSKLKEEGIESIENLQEALEKKDEAILEIIGGEDKVEGINESITELSK